MHSLLRSCCQNLKPLSPQGLLQVSSKDILANAEERTNSLEGRLVEMRTVAWKARQGKAGVERNIVY